MKVHQKTKLEKRKDRVKSKILVSEKRPRLTIYRSNRYLYAQILGEGGKVLVSATNVGGKASRKKTKKDEEFELGKDLAKRAEEKKIKKVVFDRNGYKYHGRIKRFAEGAREGGLIF